MNDKIDYENNLVENLYMLCKDRRLVIPNKLQESTAISWYHHYLQHPGHTRLQKPWSKRCIGLRWNHLSGNCKQCKSCQVTNTLYTVMVEYHTNLYLNNPLENVMCWPDWSTYAILWKVLSVDLTGLYTIKGKDISRCNRLSVWQ